jgi:hypothetical protein
LFGVLVVCSQSFAGLLDEVLIHVMTGCISDAENIASSLIIVHVPCPCCTNPQSLHASCERLVSAFLIASSVHLFLIPGRITQMRIHVLVVEPWTIAGFPFQTTDHTELGCTAAGHVVTSFFQFHHG